MDKTKLDLNMEKPLVSLCIYTYKQEGIVRETLDAAVAQDYENLEIVVSDDCSPDNTFEVIRDYVSSYKGKHKFIINKNETNLGIGGNVMKLMSLSHGEFIVSNCGDDLSVPNRVSRSVELMLQEKVFSMSFGMTPIQGFAPQNGFFEEERNELVKFSISDYINDNFKASGASRIMRRDVVDVFGPLNPDCPTEDSPFTLRALLLGGIAYSYEHLVQYRIHEENTSRGATYLKRINPLPIYNQYKKDIDTAIKNKLISNEIYDALQKRISNYLKLESLQRKIYFKGGTFLRGVELIKVLLTINIPIKIKKKLVGKYLYWYKNGI